jgi:Domain of unknown function (DUF3459)
MPTSSPLTAPPDPNRPRATCNCLLTIACLLLASLARALPSAQAQTLAHPGWVGNGLNVDPWWQHAVFYEVTTSATPDFKDIATRLNALRFLGVDALLLPAPTLKPQSTAADPDPTLDDFDELIHQASRQSMRILLTIPTSSVTSDVSGTAHFWLNHGVAGFHVATSEGTTPQDAQTITQLLRKLTASAAGQRIVITDFDLSTPDTATAVPTTSHHATPHPTSRRTSQPTDAPAAQLQFANIKFLGSPDGTTLRPPLVKSLTQPNILLNISFETMGVTSLPARQTDQPTSDRPLANVLATILLTLQPASLISSTANLTLDPNAPPIDTPPPPPPPPPPPTPVVPEGTFVPYVPPPKPVTPPLPPAPSVATNLTDWYRQLITLRHGNAALRSGTITMLDFDQQSALVWAARPASNSPLVMPVVILCNLSATTVHLDLGAAIKTLNLRGTYLRTLLRSDKAMGPQDLNGVILPPYSVYIGELRR